jgi:hypothetical protein
MGRIVMRRKRIGMSGVIGRRRRMRRPRIALRRRWILAVLGVAVVSQLGCATVAPYQREFLADRIMDPAQTGRERSMERHWLDTREGAMGGALGAGGGCACN